MEMDFFATAAKGVEEVLAAEIKSLGVQAVTLEKGGVRFKGDMKDCYRANLWLRTAHRVLVTVAEFACETPQQLYDGVRAISWQQYLTPDLTLAVSCNLRDSKITHSGFAALKAKDAIVDSLRDSCGRRPNVDSRSPDLQVNLHLVRNYCTVSLDSSGSSLDKRGYRLDRKEAPLRESLAAAIIDLSGWDGNVPLVDPMCGSGTIPVEAALKASRRAPGLTRAGFGFQRWMSFDPETWSVVLKEAQEQVEETLSVPILGSDLSVGALDVARKNADRAGVGNLVTFSRAGIGEGVSPASPGILLCNPPYGIRLGDEEALRILYKKLGDTLKKFYSGYTAFVLCGNPSLASCIGLRPARRIVLFNGAIECRLLRYELY
ncbi:MAG: RNA methyltransferase [Deltaproteobacteria bacterium]|nr:RNA methyltransferase [Deltaproteobacteria bacterium]TLN02821.1 MAG: RNA methyltransferase [bacterium]